MNRFPKLFSPISIGGLEIKNRLVWAPTSCELANSDGTVSPEMVAYYEERARGGVGLIIVETTHIDRRGKRLPHNPFLDEDRFIPGMRKLTQQIKEGGAKAGVQLCHGGIACVSSIAGCPPVGPSRVPCKITHVSPEEGEVPQELTVEQIHQIIEAFIGAAVRAKKAGFDAVQVHGAHGYLISNFLSPDSNYRTDAYGGPIRNRVRMFEEIVRGIKERVGPGFPIIARINCRDYVKGGLEFPDTLVACQVLEEAGADAIDLSGGTHSSEPYMIGAHMSVPPACFVEYAAQLKRHVRVPVITVNRIHDPALAEAILERGDADMVAMGRPLLADPQLPEKAIRGVPEDIVPCISCNECFASLYSGRIACTVNPFAGRESALKERVEKKPVPKRIVVIGGGVGGMSCAIMAARFHHRVTLFEQQPLLGGMLRVAMLAPNRNTLPKLLAYFERQVEKLEIEVRLSEPFSMPEAKKMAADVYVVATGAVPFVPSIPGVERENVVAGLEALHHPEKVGPRCIIYGGGLLAMELADFLMTQNGRQVIMIVRSKALKKANFSDKFYYLDRLRKFGVEIREDTQIVEILPKGVTVEPSNKWKMQILDVDTVIMATGWTSVDDLATELMESGFKTVVVGDAVAPRKLLSAIHEGASAGLTM
jgi:2,4-dienoyl-CoA reductase-like NADH-dependent reductase (Old Yellow Enzyme family)/thioredoxin reductase